jgi:7-cyano-7-deazaguanine tRNA-ribosyltransferase
MRMHAHPALLSALKHLRCHEDFLEKFSPTVKSSGFFYFDSVGLVRPEITHYRKRLSERYSPPKDARVLFLVPQTRNKPFHKAPEFKKIRQLLRVLGKENALKIHVCVFAAPFGVVPLELDEVYPLSQHEATLPLDMETVDYVATQAAEYIKRSAYGSIVLLNDKKLWQDIVKKACRSACKTKNIPFDAINADVGGTKEILTQLQDIFQKRLCE